MPRRLVSTYANEIDKIVKILQGKRVFTLPGHSLDATCVPNERRSIEKVEDGKGDDTVLCIYV